METAEHLLATHVSPPLDACTYMGLDSGARPVQVTGGVGWGPLALGRGPDTGSLVVPFFSGSVSLGMGLP